MRRSIAWRLVFMIFSLGCISLSAGNLGYNLGKQGALLPDVGHVALVGLGLMFLWVVCSRNIHWDRMDE